VTDLNVSFIPWQEEVWSSKKKYKIVVAGRRCGKTEYAAWSMLIKALSDGLDGHRFYVAPTQGQARDVMWKKLMDLGNPVIASRHINNLEITLINGQTISLKGADRPETMRGVKLADCVLDEYGDMKEYVLEEILLPAMTDLDAPLLLIGSPMGRNHFYEVYTKAKLGNDPDWGAWHFTSFDNPFLSKDLLEKRREKMSSYAFRQEFMASFEARGSEIFQEDWVKFSDKEPEGSYYIACDLAGFEELGKKKRARHLDDSAIAVVKVNESGWWVKEIIIGRWDVNKTAEHIFEAVRKYQPVSVGIERGIARNAVLGPLMDSMRRTQRFFRIEELTHGNKNKTDRVIHALQGRFEHGYITLNTGSWNSKFLDQLFQFPDPLTHDDAVDALAYIDQLQTVAYGGDLVLVDYAELDAFTGY